MSGGVAGESGHSLPLCRCEGPPALIRAPGQRASRPLIAWTWTEQKRSANGWQSGHFNDCIQ
jgi:hypothetical protein